MKKDKSIINNEVYGLYCGVLIFFIGVLWCYASIIFINIGAFGLLPIAYMLPVTGGIVILFGLFVFLRSLVHVSKYGVKLKKNEVINNDTKIHIKHRYQGIIFDLDGTLLDTMDDLAKAGNSLLNDLGFKPQPRNYFEQYLGNGIYNLVSKIIPKPLTKEELDSAYSRFLSYYSQCYNMDTKPYDGVLETINKLEKMGYLLAVVSNKKDEYLQELIKMHFPNNNFVTIIGEKEGYPKKPDPSIAKMIADKMMIETKNLVMVGDSEVDINFARNGDMLSVAVTYGFRNQRQLIKYEPDYLIDEMASLIDVVVEENSKD